MKSVLLPIGPAAGDEARLATAIALVRSRGGHLICIQVLPPPIVLGFMGHADLWRPLGLDPVADAERSELDPGPLADRCPGEGLEGAGRSAPVNLPNAHGPVPNR